MNRVAVALVFVLGCSGTEDRATNEVGVSYTAVQDDLVTGTFETQYGSVQFESRVTSEGVVDVTFAKDERAFGSHVDWNALTVDLVVGDDHQVTNDDRFLLRALVSALEHDLGNEMPAADNLIRQANVWSIQPDGAVQRKQIVADPERGWTRLCGVNNYTFGHDSNGHGWSNEYLACGIYERSNPCRDRCGPGCVSWWGSSAWTKHCGDHDRCEQLHSTSECAGEAWGASDDFSFAGNC